MPEAPPDAWTSGQGSFSPDDPILLVITSYFNHTFRYNVEPHDHRSKYGYGAQSILLCGEYYASARGLRCTLSEEELCGRRADW